VGLGFLDCSRKSESHLAISVLGGGDIWNFGDSNQEKQSTDHDVPFEPSISERAPFICDYGT